MIRANSDRLGLQELKTDFSNEIHPAISREFFFVFPYVAVFSSGSALNISGRDGFILIKFPQLIFYVSLRHNELWQQKEIQKAKKVREKK
jgi:hypothetical protein